MKWTDKMFEQAYKMLLAQKTYKEIGSTLNVSDMSVRAALMRRYSIKRANVYSPYVTKQCLQCDTAFTITRSTEKKYGSKFCSQSCAATYNNTRRTRKKKYCIECGTELKTGKKYCSNTCMAKHMSKNIVHEWLTGKHPGAIRGGSCQLLSAIKNYVMERASNKCEECDCNKINPYNGKSILQIDHIDGNALNNNPNNLKVLCPNCHAMTKYYGNNGNHISARRHWRKKIRSI